MTLPSDYPERAYAAVLGKLIGVYLGRPFEGWTYQRIMRELGPIENYVHERLKVPLVVTDDDVAGTFTFIRALEDHRASAEITSREIGETWLNYIVERRAILWWGGAGNSTEHTAWLNLKRGIAAPDSGSIKVNGQAVAEQIGAQIFIDGWAIVAPGNPALAAELAEKAARVSHDGAAVDAAKLWAAMEAEAFISRDVEHLIDVGLAHIPSDSAIAKLIADIRAWRERYPDWRDAREKIEAHYGYDKYPGNCHVIPNHALMIMALLYAPDDFSKAQTIVCTSGWDTDCNAGNVGCLMGAMLGLEGIDAGGKWRGPLADRMLISSADGGYSINDAVRVAPDWSTSGEVWPVCLRRLRPRTERSCILVCRVACRVSRAPAMPRRRSNYQRSLRGEPRAGAALCGARARAGRRADADVHAARGRKYAHLRADGDAAHLSRSESSRARSRQFTQHGRARDKLESACLRQSRRAGRDQF